MEGLVPGMEEREATLFCGYTWKEWRGLDYSERVYGVAYFRMRRIIAMHQEDAVNRALEAKAKAPRH